jgi:peptide/nickel transport system ATP-binding protein
VSLLVGRGLTVRYGKATVLQDVDLTLDAGEIVAVVGRSGSGKTTLGRAVCGLVPHEGALTLEGRPLRRRTREDRRRIQMVFQDPFASLNPVHTVRHHLERPLSLHQRSIGPEDLMHAVGLDVALLDRHPHQLSGGQRQRVAIARAIAPEPAVLVADEPTSMLDVTLRLGVLQLLAGMREQRSLSILLITHDLAIARLVADRIVVLDAGRVVEEGATRALLDGPTHPATRRLLAARRS